jgi:phosphoribosylformylglycinamidine (FGAM) synthase-like enzyme
MTVGDGGMVSALEMMCSEGVGASIDISGVMKAYGEKKGNRVLFSEVPGALIQVRDLDYDYIDAEFLLQDVAYFPLGHPVKGDGSVKVRTGGGGISEILQSLLSSQASEGED